MELKKAPREFWIGLFFCLLLWLYLLAFLPTFDLDESLYRRVAEDMKFRRDWWHPYWDMVALYHKPPILYWLINLCSALIDRTPLDVSVAAARMPGLIVACVTTFILGWRRSLFLWLAMFPLLTVCSVIFDPLQTLALLPAILLPERWFSQDRTATRTEFFMVGASLFLATAIKGLNGIVIPTFAIGIHLCLRDCKQNFRFFICGFLPAVLACLAYYWYLDQKMGRGFTHEYFWVHHFGRSQSAMEQHGGGALYYPLVLMLGAGALLPFLVSSLTSLKGDYKRRGYLITFVLSFILLFSFSATKLPHYLWPAWPALAIFVAQNKRFELTRVGSLLASLPIFLLATVALFLSLNPIHLLHDLGLPPTFSSIIPADFTIPWTWRICFAGAALTGALLVVRRKFWIQSPEKTFALASLMLLFFGIGMTNLLSDRIQKPIDALAADLNALHLPYGTCVWYAGPDSPSLSLAIGHNLFPNRCTIEETLYLIAPDWQVDQCIAKNMELLSHRGYLNLCKVRK